MTTYRLNMHSGDSRRVGGFTLVELIVAMGIIIVLAGLLVPMLLKAYGAADRSRINSQLALIGTAIDSYRQDFNDIPRWDPTPDSSLLMPGANLLGLKLIGPLDATGLINTTVPTMPASGDLRLVTGVVSTYAGTAWFVVPTIGGGDGVNGPGFKSASKADFSKTAGPVRGPYVDPNRFIVRGTLIQDAAQNPVLYYPSRNRRADVRVATSGYIDVGPTPSPTDDPRLVLRRRVFNSFDNTPEYLADRLTFAIVMGDTNNNGLIDNGDTQRAGSDYVLWTAGPDRQLGVQPGVTMPAVGELVQRRDYVRKLDDCFFNVE
jgi:type II secretory pathway pseudopilin PulG